MRSAAAPRLYIVLTALTAFGLLAISPIQAQVSLTTLGTPYTQSFDTLPASGSTTWTNNSNIPGWFHARTGTGTTIVANNGSSNAGNLYSYGTGTATDRALGSLGSGNAAIGNLFWGVRLQNNTGATITSLDVSYTGEQWRNSAAAAQTVAFSYLVGSPTVTGSLAEFQSAGVAVASLDFTSPITGGAAGALDGNLAANRVTLTFSITGLSIPNGTEVMLRWSDPDHTGADHGLSIDDFSVTPQGVVAGINLTVTDVTLAEGDSGTTTFAFQVNLSAPAGPGGVTFDIATQDDTAEDGNPLGEDDDYVAQSLTGQNIPLGSVGPFTFNVLVNGDTDVEVDETFFVNVTNVVGTGVTVTDGQGLGTITNDDIAFVFIHDVQGNGAATPIPAATVTVEGIVIGDYQGSTQLSGFFLQEEDTDADANPATSEGIFVFCMGCPTAVAEGQRVRVTGSVSEFFNLTEITAGTAGSVVVTNAGNNLALVTPAAVDLPVAGVVNDFYEAREGMLVTFVDTLTVAEYFELFRFGHIELFEGGRPRQFTEMSPPSVAGLTAHLDNLDRRRVILDDTDNTPNAPLNLLDGSQFVFHPRANGGFSVGTQGTDFFRGGDLVNGLTGVLHWSFAGSGSPDAWRIRPTATTPAAFTVANPRPATPPAVGGAIKAVGMNLLNYFTTIDTTSSSSSGPCAPSGTLDCRGADSVAELNRQRERASIVICALNADVYGFGELENTTASDTIDDLLGAVNALCGGANPYAFVDTGGTLGTDAIRVELIYRSATLSPVGSALVDLDPVHNRPPTAQTFDVIDAANPAFGERFTVIANHFKSKGCPGTGPDADAGDGASCFNGARTAQATRLLAWISSTVLPAAGDPDVLLLGDFNSYAQEDPVTTITGGGFTDLESADPNAYSFLFDGQLGHLDYAFSSSSLTPQVTGVGAWHINADEVPLFDYNDEIRDSPGEATFEEKPDGSTLVPPRVLFQPASPFRAADHDPILVGLFKVADLSITKTDGVTTAVPGGSVTYTITASNAGPDPVTGGTVTDTFPGILTCTWTCVGAGGGTCTAAGSGNISDTVNLPVGGSVTYTASCTIAASATGTLENTASVSGGAAGDPDTGNNSATDTDTLTPQADLAVTKTDGVTTATPGGSVTYTITASNSGPSDAPGSTVADTFPTELTCTWTCAGSGGGTCTAAGSGDIADTVNLPAGGSVTYTASCTISPSALNTVSNTATVTEPAGVTDPVPDNNSATDTDSLASQADLAITKTDGLTTVTPGGSLTYTIVASNAGPSDAPGGASVADTFPAELTCTWTCAGAGGGACNASGAGNIGEAVFLPAGGSVTFTASCTVSLAASGTISNTATVSMMGGGPTDPDPDNNSATDSDTVDLLSDYFTVTPCRAVDTRGGSPLQDGVPQTFALHGVCGIPATARTVVLNVTVVEPTGSGELTIHPSDAPAPAFSTMPFPAGATRALMVVVQLSQDVNGEVTVLPSVAGGGTVDVVIDVMGFLE